MFFLKVANNKLLRISRGAHFTLYWRCCITEASTAQWLVNCWLWKWVFVAENWPDVVGGVNLVGVNCPLLTSSLGLHQCLIGCGGLWVNILEGFFCLWSRLQPLCSNVNSVLIAQNVCLKRVTQHAAKCWKNVRESLVIFFPWKLLPRCFAYRRVSAEDLRAMAALDASKLPYGMQERFYQVLHRQYLGLIVWENLSKNWNI